MMKRLWAAIRPILFWSYRRGSWQYDVVCAAILLFIFLPPHSFFNDRPRPPTVREIQSLGEDVRVFWVGSEVVEQEPADESGSRLSALLKQRTGHDLRVVETRPMPREDGHVDAYLVYAKP